MNLRVDVPIISVIVPIYKHWNIVWDLFDSIDSQSLSRDKWELLVVDNGSNNIPSISELPEFVTLLECSVPGSYAARNTAIKVAQGKLLVFTDADCRPIPTWLENIYNIFEKQKVPSLIAGDVHVDRLSFGEPNLIELYDIALGLPQSRYVKRGYAVTANLSIPIEIFNHIGLFDSKRFSGGDVDFCLRARESGYGLEFEKNAIVLHPARSQWGELSQKIKRVKGGQIKAGSFNRRLQFFIRTFIPPVRALYRSFQCDRISFVSKIKVCGLLVRLWFLEMREVLSLVCGKKPERR